MTQETTYPARRINRQPGSDKHRIEQGLLEELGRLGGRQTTARFLFYQLVDRQVIPKERKDIKKQPINVMYEVLTALRWAGVIPFGQIIDDGRDPVSNRGYLDLLDAGREAIDRARFDPWDGGDPPQIWVEDAGTGQLLRSVTYRYCVPVVAMSGQPSGGLCYEVAQTVGPGTRILYLGDWDRGGHRIQKSATERIAALAGAWIDAGTLHERFPQHNIESYMYALDTLIEDGKLDVPEPLDLNIERIAITPEQAEPLDRLTTWKTYDDGTRMEVIELQALGQDLIERLVIETLDAELAERGLAPIEDADEETDTQRDRLSGLLADLG